MGNVKVMTRELAMAVGGMLMLMGSMVSAQEDAHPIVRACAGDVDRLCAGVPPGEGRIKECMRAHLSELSAPCLDAILGAISAGKEPS